MGCSRMNKNSFKEYFWVENNQKISVAASSRKLENLGLRTLFLFRVLFFCQRVARLSCETTHECSYQTQNNRKAEQFACGLASQHALQGRLFTGLTVFALKIYQRLSLVKLEGYWFNTNIHSFLMIMMKRRLQRKRLSHW